MTGHHTCRRTSISPARLRRLVVRDKHAWITPREASKAWSAWECSECGNYGGTVGGVL